MVRPKFACSMLLLCSVLLAGMAVPAFGQIDDICGSDARPEDIPLVSRLMLERAYDLPSLPGDFQSAPILVPITVHVVRRNDQTGGLSPERVAQAIVDSNVAFGPANIKFYRCGPIRYIDDDDYFLNIDTNEEMDQLVTEDRVENTINLYIVGALSANGGGLCGRSMFTHWDPPHGIITKDTCTGSVTNPSTVPHEIGHYFDLYHTHDSQFGDECADGSNGNSAGDLLSDTPADPRLVTNPMSPDYNCDSNCNYFGPDLDPCGDPYAPDTTNLMCYAPKTCRTEFTPQQIAKMRATLLNLRPELIGGCTNLGGVITGSTVLSAGSPGNPVVFARRACGGERDCTTGPDGSTDDFLTATIQVQNDLPTNLVANLRLDADRSVLNPTLGLFDAVRFFRPVGGGPRLQNPMTFPPGTTEICVEVKTSIKQDLVDQFPIDLPFVIWLESVANPGDVLDFVVDTVGLRPTVGYYDDDVVDEFDLPRDPAQAGDAVVVKFAAEDLPGEGTPWNITGVQIVGAEIGGVGLPGLSSVELRIASAGDPDEPDLTPGGLVRSATAVTFSGSPSTIYVDFPDLNVPAVPNRPNLFIVCHVNPGDSLGTTASALGFSVGGPQADTFVQTTSFLIDGALVPDNSRMAMVRLDLDGALAP